MSPDERHFWYAITLVGSGAVLIGTSTQNGWGECLTLVGALWIVWLERGRIWSAIRSPWQFLRRRSVEETDKLPPMRDAVAMVCTPSPNSLNELPWVEFITEGIKARHIDTNGRRPKKLRFIMPNEQVVEDLPAIVRLGKGRLIIKRFTDTGFLIEEDKSIDEHAKAEIYFADDAASGNPIVGMPSAKSEPSPSAGMPIDAKTNPFFAPVEAAPAVPTKEALDILFGADDSASFPLVWLKFLPDTPNREEYPNRNGDAFLLILLGYRFLREWEQVPTDHARGSLAFSHCHFAQPDLREWVTPGPQLEPDPVAGPYIRRGYIEKAGLASGGKFRLTSEGMREAMRLFQDVIKRA
jgi:hypothetical protein